MLFHRKGGRLQDIRVLLIQKLHRASACIQVYVGAVGNVSSHMGCAV